MLVRSQRLRDNRDILRVLQRGRSVRTAHLKLIILANNHPQTRAAAVISKRIDKRAVVRNRNRRRVIEVIRINLAHLKSGFDILVYIQSDLSAVTSVDLEAEIMQGLHKLGV